MIPITPEFVNEKVKEGRRYTLVLLKAGPAAASPEAETQDVRMAHVQHLFVLLQEGHLLVNGPILDDPVYKGLAIFQSDDPAVVNAFLADDPAIRAGLFTYELRSWFSVPGWGVPAAS